MLLHHILSLIAYTFRGTGNWFSLSLCSLWWVQIDSRIRFGLQIVFVFIHHTISLASSCTLIWRHWTFKMPVKYSLLSVWVRLNIYSQLSIIQYVGICVFSLPVSLVMIDRTLTLSQCTLAGPVYTGIPLECHWLTHCTLEHHWKNLVETAPHWNATGETYLNPPHTGMPLDKL